MGHLSVLGSLPMNSLVRQATIVDALLRAALPSQRYYEHIEEIQKAVEFIARQA